MARKLSKHRPQQGARLMDLRKAANLTQAELAELIGELQQTIAFWEQSDKPPRSDALPKLADVLGVRVDDFLTVDRAPTKRSGPVGRVRRIFEEVSKLPRRHQNKVIEFVSAFVNEHKRSAG